LRFREGVLAGVDVVRVSDDNDATLPRLLGDEDATADCCSTCTLLFLALLAEYRTERGDEAAASSASCPFLRPPTRLAPPFLFVILSSSFSIFHPSLLPLMFIVLLESKPLPCLYLPVVDVAPDKVDN